MSGTIQTKEQLIRETEKQRKLIWGLVVALILSPFGWALLAYALGFTAGCELW